MPQDLRWRRHANWLTLSERAIAGLMDMPARMRGMFKGLPPAVEADAGHGGQGFAAAPPKVRTVQVSGPNMGQAFPRHDPFDTVPDKMRADVQFFSETPTLLNAVQVNHFNNAVAERLKTEGLIHVQGHQFTIEGFKYVLGALDIAARILERGTIVIDLGAKNGWPDGSWPYAWDELKNVLPFYFQHFGKKYLGDAAGGNGEWSAHPEMMVHLDLSGAFPRPRMSSAPFTTLMRALGSANLITLKLSVDVWPSTENWTALANMTCDSNTGSRLDHLILKSNRPFGSESLFPELGREAGANTEMAIEVLSRAILRRDCKLKTLRFEGMQLGDVTPLLDAAQKRKDRGLENITITAGADGYTPLYMLGR